MKVVICTRDSTKVLKASLSLIQGHNINHNEPTDAITNAQIRIYQFQCRLRFTSCILDQCAVDGAAVSGGVCGVARRYGLPKPQEEQPPSYWLPQRVFLSRYIVVLVRSAAALTLTLALTHTTMVVYGNFCPKSIYDRSQLQVPTSKKLR